jgi:hypothetical protein
VNLRTIREGDIVQLAGDESAVWWVRGREQRRVTVELVGRPAMRRPVAAREITAHWQRRRNGSRQ